MNVTGFGPKIAAALVAAQKEMPSITKDATNPAFKSKFASLDGIMEEVRPALAKHGLTVVQGSTTPHTDESGKVTAFVGETMLIHESGEWLMSTVVMPMGKSDPQGAGSAMTYSRRYSLSALLALSTEEDDDGNAASSTAKRTTAKPVANPATTDNAPITRETPLSFGTKTGTKIKDLKDSYLQWALEPERKFGIRTLEWQAAFRAELAHRDSGVLLPVT